jgi:hypothetical protein
MWRKCTYSQRKEGTSAAALAAERRVPVKEGIAEAYTSDEYWAFL